MDEGYRLYQRGDYLRALEAFQAADAIMGVPTTSLYVAKAQEKRGMLLESLDALVRVQTYPQAPNEPAPFSQARTEAEALEADILERIPTLEVALAPLPATATVKVALDGAELAPERVHLPRKLNPGVHHVVVSAPGFVAYDQRLVLREREHQRLEVKLEPVPKAPPARPPRLEPEPDVPEVPSAVPPAAWAAFGVGAAGLVVGTVAGTVALYQRSELEDDCSDQHCEDDKWESDRGTMMTAAHVSTAGFAVAGAGAAVGLILVLVSDPNPELAAGTIQPVLGLGTVGLSGRF